MRTTSISRIGTLTLMAALAMLVRALPALADSKEGALPPAASEALKAEFPGGKIADVEREREKGVPYYEVDVQWQGRELEVEVTADGLLGKVQEDVNVKTLPAAVVSKMGEVVDRDKVRKIEKHEIRGVVRNGAFVQLAAPEVVYEIKARGSDGARIELRLDPAGKVLAGEIDEHDDEADDEHDGEHEDDDD